MLTYEICKDLVLKSSDACECPLEKCCHDRVLRPHLMNKWLTDIVIMKNLNNKQGRVYTAKVNYENESEIVVLKHFNKEALAEHAKREFKSGYQLNLLRLPMFVESYGGFYRRSGPYNMTRYIEGPSFKSAMYGLSRQQFISITMQLCMALEIAQSSFRFGHYDLHLENVLLHFSNVKTQILFDQYHVSFSNCWIPVIIDLGMSCGKNQSDQWGITHLEKKGIYPELRPGYDMFVFFLYCYQESQLTTLTKRLPFNDVVEKVLTRFFNHPVDKPNLYLNTLVKGAERKTPKQLFEFLKILSTQIVVKPRLVYSLELPNSKNVDVFSFVDQMYYKTNGLHTPASDLISFRSKNMEYKVNMYYKIQQTGLNALYSQWLDKFKPTLNKYWKNRDLEESQARIKWQSLATENVSVN
jgi:hypothetical protein